MSIISFSFVKPFSTARKSITLTADCAKAKATGAGGATTPHAHFMFAEGELVSLTRENQSPQNTQSGSPVQVV
jgi:hypothetical protein